MSQLSEQIDKYGLREEYEQVLDQKNAERLGKKNAGLLATNAANKWARRAIDRAKRQILAADKRNSESVWPQLPVEAEWADELRWVAQHSSHEKVNVDWSKAPSRHAYSWLRSILEDDKIKGDFYRNLPKWKQEAEKKVEETGEQLVSDEQAMMDLYGELRERFGDSGPVPVEAVIDEDDGIADRPGSGAFVDSGTLATE